ncbi:MAG: BTAD domain-containing putative transcriptional regulator [Rhodovibrionaceae bacterium]|nr:BTAD domain-containing putative transcriptional regulator [Rhodovibrionaceae bacterium]
MAEPEFEEWARAERQHLHDLAVGIAEKLLDNAQETGDAGQAIFAARALLHIDPLREDIHRVLMAAYAKHGQRARAIQHFDDCRALLKRELDLEPEPETIDLAAAIRGKAAGGNGAAGALAQHAASSAAVAEDDSESDSPRLAVRPGVSFPLRRLSGALLLFVVLVAGVAWLRSVPHDFLPVDANKLAFALPDKPSIVVLPFANLSEDPNQSYLSDALTDSMITELSRFSELFVISRNSAFTYKNKPATVQQVAQEMGVRYVVEGSLQRANGRVRVNVQLLDAIGGSHLWSERYDRKIGDLFEIQDRIVRTVVATLYGKVVKSERKRIRKLKPADLRAYEYIERGADLYMQWTQESVREARRWLERAIEIKPNSVRALFFLTSVYRDGHRMGWLDMPRDEALRRARRTAERALAIDSGDYQAHWAMAKVHKSERNTRKVLNELEKARELNPNNALLLWATGDPLIFLGRFEEGLSRYTEAMRLNPHHPDWWYWNYAWAQYTAGHCEEALNSIQQMKPLPNMARRELAPIYVCLGQVEKARKVIRAFLEEEPDYTLDDYRHTLIGRYEDPVLMHRLLADLSTAGLPDPRSQTAN